MFGSGYLANAGIIPVLIGRDGLVLADELSHACLFAGAQLSRGTVMTFRHNDVAHARELLERHRAEHDRALIVTDGVFSMDGDLAPLAELLALANEHDAWLMSDDAHGLGVVGGGRGSSFVGNSHIPVPLQMGTLSKAVGAYGGYLCASSAVIDLIRNRARTLIYSTGLPPSCVAAEHRRARPDRARAGLRRSAGAKGKGVHQSRRPARSAKPDRAGDHRRGRSNARGVATARRRRLPRRRHPAADACRPAPRACGLPSPRSIPTSRLRGSRVSSANGS